MVGKVGVGVNPQGDLEKCGFCGFLGVGRGKSDHIQEFQTGTCFSFFSPLVSLNLKIVCVCVGLYSWVAVRWIFVMCFILFPSFCVVKSN